MFYSQAKLMAALVLGLAGTAVAVPAAVPTQESASDGGLIINHRAFDYFPHAVGDLSAWDMSVHFTGYNSSMESWLNSLDPSSGANDDKKAEILLSAAYARPFDGNDADMADDKKALLGAVAGHMPKDIVERVAKRNSRFIVSTAHVVLWHACSAFFSCVSGTSCTFSIDIGKAPRSRCENHGGQNCCISWSTYNVQAGFFKRTWTNCDVDVENAHLDKASCEGKGDNTGGDVCLSNRATGCT